VRGERPGRRPMEGHLLGTMFDRSRLLERVLSTGTVVRLRVEELDGGTALVHQALRRRGDGPWVRWPEFEGEQSIEKLCLERCVVLDG
jgi:hypothetical protein